MSPIIIGLVLLSLGGVFFSQYKFTTMKDDTKVDQVVSVDLNDPIDSTADPSPSPSSLPTVPPIKPDNSSGPNSAVQNQSDWNYPGATQVSTGVLESSDDPQAVTDWYKDKINQLGLNAKSFVQTNTNNQILNKLSGASSSMKVDIEIKKNPGDVSTQITVTQN